MTKRNNSKNKASSRQVVDNLSKPSPRMNLRGRLNENVTNITANEYNTPAIVTANNTLGYGQVYLAPGNPLNRLSAPANSIGAYFQKGLYLPGTYVKYIPSVGLTTNGNVILAYLDSPTAMVDYFNLPAGQQLDYIRGLSSARTGPVWQELMLPVTAPPRRKVFNVDQQINTGTADELDQSMQAIVLWCVYGVDTTSVPKAFGQILVHAKLRFEEVKTTVSDG